MAKTSNKSKNSYAVKNICIVYRARSREAFKEAQKLANHLFDLGIKVFTHPEQNPLKNAKKVKNAQLDDLDLLIVLGGDGTYLFACDLIQGRNIPVMGVNMGSLGFLTETKLDDLYTYLELALQNKMEYEKRSVLSVEVHKIGEAKNHYYALNDIVLDRGPFSRLIQLSIESGEHLISELKADGLIIATPTGSTAYNLAAGGPIIHPKTPAIVVTPICAHSLTSKPIVLPNNKAITVRALDESQKIYFMIDGQKKENLGPQDQVIIKLAEVQHILVKPPGRCYFDLLSKKLHFGQRL